MNSVPWERNADVIDFIEHDIDNSEFDTSPEAIRKALGEGYENASPRSTAYRKEVSARKSAKRKRDFTLLEWRKIGDKPFWLNWVRADQGRFYTTQENVDVQGSKDYSRPVFYFKNRVKIGKFGLKKMKAQAIDFLGITGTTLENRAALFDAKKEMFLKWGSDVKKYKSEIKAFAKATEIDGIGKKKGDLNMVVATLIELSKAHKHPTGPTNFPSGLPIWGDASASGPQLIANFLGYSKLGKYTNLTESISDLYSFIGTKVLRSVVKPVGEKLKIYNEVKSKLDSFDKRMKAEKDNKKRGKIFYEKVEYTNSLPKNKLIQYAEATAYDQVDLIAARLRDVFKNPVMIINYAAGVRKMADGIYSTVNSKTEANIDYATALGLAKSLSDQIAVEFPLLGTFMRGLQGIARKLYNEGQAQLTKEIRKEGSKDLNASIDEYISNYKVKEFRYAELIAKSQEGGRRSSVGKNASEAKKAKQKQIKDARALVSLIREEISDVDNRLYERFSFISEDGFRFIQTQRFVETHRGPMNYDGSDRDTLNRNKSGEISYEVAIGPSQLSISDITTGIVAEFIQGSDSGMVSWIQNHTEFDNTAVHDDFAAAAGHQEALYKAKRDALDAVSGEGKLEKIITQVAGKEEAAKFMSKFPPRDLDPSLKYKNDAAFDGGNARYEETIAEVKKARADYRAQNAPQLDLFGEGGFFDAFQVPLQEGESRYRYKNEADPEFKNKRQVYIDQAKQFNTKWYNPKNLKEKGLSGFFRSLVPFAAEEIRGLVHTGQEIIGDTKELFQKYADANYNFLIEKSKQRKIIADHVKALEEAGFKLDDKSGVTLDGIELTVAQAIKGMVTTSADKTAELMKFASNPAVGKYIKDMKEMGVLTEPRDNMSYRTANPDTDRFYYFEEKLRSEFFHEFSKEAERVFTPEVMRKLAAKYGIPYVDAIQEALQTMAAGRKTNPPKSAFAKGVSEWVSAGTGLIMFLNFKSAALQLISIPNIIFDSKNPGQVLANMFNPSTFAKAKKLFSHAYLQERRAAAGFDVNAAEVVEIINSSDSYNDLARKLLKFGFGATSIADSMAISFSGAAYINAEVNAGVSEEAATRAWVELSEKSQQSSRPDRVSQWQRDDIAKFILAFANTPMQYFRLSLQAFRDMKAGKDPRGNLMKIGYYMFAQNLLFTVLSSASAALLGFGDPEDDEKEIKQINGMLDTFLRGMGFYGAIIDTIKDIGVEYFIQSEYKKNPNYQKAFLEILNISPLFDKRVQDALAIGNSIQYDDKNKVWVIVAKTGEFINLPTGWVLKKFEAVNALQQEQYSNFEKFLIAVGWPEYAFKEGKGIKGQGFNADLNFGGLDLDLNLEL